MTAQHSPQEAPKYSPATEALLAEISGATYRSQVNGRKVMMEATRIRPRLAGEELDAIEAARQKRWGELTISREAELGLDIPEAPEPGLPVEEPWSPTRGMTDEGVTRELDWAERAANDRDH